MKALYQITMHISCITDRLEEQNVEIMDGLDPEYAYFVFSLNNVFSFCRITKCCGFGGSKKLSLC